MTVQMKKIFILFFLCFFGCTKQTPSPSEDTTSKTPPNANSTTNSSPTSTPLPENTALTGMIDNRLPITMQLRRAGSSLAGTYQYVNKGQDLQVQGTISDDVVMLTEFDASGKATGLFEGKWAGSSLAGTWQTPDKKRQMPFSLLLQPSSTITQKKATISSGVASSGVVSNGAVTVNKKTISRNEKGYSAEVTYPELSGMDNVTTQNQINQALKTFASNRLNRFLADAKQNANETMGDYELQIDFSQGLVNQKMANFLFSIYSYTGGAHPNTVTEAQNFNLQTGRKLALADFMKPDYLSFLSDFSRVALKKEEAIQSENAGGDDQWLKDGTAPKVENFDAFMLTSDGLSIHFDAYQVASYAAGPFDMTVPYSRMIEMIKPNSVASGLK
jgi:hypothetical protein